MLKIIGGLPGLLFLVGLVGVLTVFRLLLIQGSGA